MQASDLYRPSLFRWSLAASGDWAMILAAMGLALWLNHAAAYLLALLVIGNRQHALSILGHEGSHRLVCRNRWLNDALANAFCFWPMMAGVQSFRRFHFAHHRETGTDRDPELYLKRRAAPRYDLPTPRKFFMRRFALDLLGGSLDEVLVFALYIRTASWPNCFGPLVWWGVVGIFAVALGCWPAVLLWFGAMLTTYWACFRVRIWTEHVGTDGTHRVQLNWWQRLLFAPHNTWYHYEHHRWPAVPCHLLPEARRLYRTVPVVTWPELLARYRTADRVPSGQAQHQLSEITTPVHSASFLGVKEREEIFAELCGQGPRVLGTAGHDRQESPVS